MTMNKDEMGKALSELRERRAPAAVRAEPVAVNYAETVAPYVAALRMVRDAIEELFSPTASLESEEAVLLRGPEPHHDAEALITALQRISSALVASPAPSIPAGYRLVPEEPTPTHRHKKRGTEYVLIGVGKMQAEHWRDAPPAGLSDQHGRPVDMRPVAIYQSVDDGSLWARPIEEWEDGRFEVIAAPAQQREGDGE